MGGVVAALAEHAFEHLFIECLGWDRLRATTNVTRHDATLHLKHRSSVPNMAGTDRPFHEYAGLSITKSVWAKAYYEQQIARGSSTQMARRALAYKWMRIIYRCWQTREPYDEARYLARLAAAKSPLAALIVARVLRCTRLFVHRRGHFSF